jgi:hypothetical protein
MHGNRSGAGEESAVRVLLVKACAVQLSQSAARVMLSDALFSIGQETKADFVGQRPGFKL